MRDPYPYPSKGFDPQRQPDGRGDGTAERSATGRGRHLGCLSSSSSPGVGVALGSMIGTDWVQ